MTKKQLDLLVAVPDGVGVDVEGFKVNVSGSKGNLTREFRGVASIEKKDANVVIKPKSKFKKDRAVAGAVRSHIKNMTKGVSDGFTYNMKIVYSHFPMNVKAQGNTFVIDNFLGEKHPRSAKILEGVEVQVNAQDITLTGSNKENVAQTAANIEQATKIKNLDPRVFQDGIYITEKDGKSIVKK